MDFGALKVLIISRDLGICTPGSATLEHLKRQGSLVGELHVVVLSKASDGLKAFQPAPNMWVYPTNSFSEWRYASDAASIGKKIVFDRKFVRGQSVITAEDPFACGQAGLKIKKRWKLPLEVQFDTNPSGVGFWQELTLKNLLKKTNVLRVANKDLAKQVSEQFNFDEKYIAVIPPYINVKKIEEGKVHFDLHAHYGWHFILLAIAPLTQEKNLAMAIRVLAKVHAYFPDTGLVIVGDGPEKGSLEALARSLEVGGSVSFVSSQDDHVTYYRTSNLFLQTSTFESYGQELVEAGLAGLPVVTTPVGVATELEEGREAIVCPLGDTEYMFRAVYDLVENNQLRELLHSNVRRFLETKLPTEEELLKKLKENWIKIASMVSAS